MAVQLLLAKRADLTAVGAETSTLNLLTGAGLNIEYMDGWQAAIAAGNPPDAAPITDVLNLVVTGTTGDVLAAYLQNLDDKVREVQEFWEGAQERGGVWLRAQLTSETKARQAFIREAALSLGESIFTPYTDASSVIRKLALSLVRQPFWEATATTTTSAAALNCLGGTTSGAPMTVAGDVPARVPLISVVCAASMLREWWLGFRSTRYGTLANFASVWDLGIAGITRDADTTRVANGEGGFMSQCTFTAVATMLTRVTPVISDITANTSDQRGKFHVLLRAKVSNNTTVCHVQMKDGYDGALSWRTQQGYQVIDGAVTTSFFLYPLGTVTIPPTRGLSSAPDFSTFAIGVNAARVSGAGTLDMDSLVLIPYNEGAIHASAPIPTPGLALDNIYIYTREDEAIDGHTRAVVTTPPVDSLAIDCQNWGCPVGSTMCVFAAQEETAQVITDSVTLDISRYHRWRTLRGAD